MENAVAETPVSVSSPYADGEVRWVKVRGGKVIVAQFFNGLWFQFLSDDPLTVLKVFNKVNEPITKAPKKAKQRSRVDRWSDAANDAVEALTALKEVQDEYQEWYDNLPDNLRDNSPVGEKLSAICDLDIETAQSTAEEATGVDLPMGFGRD